MKNIIKLIYSLTFVALLLLTGFASARGNTITTRDCYRKNHRYQCTLKTCLKNKIKSCSYKIVKVNPPIKTKILSKNDLIPYTYINNVFIITTGAVGSRTINIIGTGLFTGSATASGIIVGTGTIMIGSTGNKSSIINIPNTSNTVSELTKFYDMISGTKVIDNNGAKFSIIEFSDFECKFCQKFHQNEVLDKVMLKYPNKINYYFVNFPLTKIHKNSAYLAKGYICASLQDKSQGPSYIKYMHSQSGDPIALIDGFKRGFDDKQFDACMMDTNTDKILEYQINIGNYVGVNATPSVMLVNNYTSEYELIAGAYDELAYQSILQTRQDRMK